MAFGDNPYDPDVTPQPSVDTGGGGGSWDWGGALKSGFEGLMGAIPSMAGAAAGYGFNSLFPGKTSLVDQRNPEQKAAQGMNLGRMQALQANQLSFGLPGDPNDPNTAAGKKKYDIVQNSRNADAGRGMFTTGGSAQRETNALNNAVGNEYNNIFNQSSQIAAGGNGMKYVEKPNPWAQLFSGLASPAVKGVTSGIMRNFGLPYGQ